MAAQERLGQNATKALDLARTRFPMVPFIERTIEYPEYIPLLERLSAILPPDVIADWYTSQPGELGAKVVFPYFRVDGYLSKVVRSGIYVILRADTLPTDPDIPDWYARVTKSLARVLIWVYVGWGSLSEFASHAEDTKPWTYGVSSTDPEVRKRDILTDGKVLLDEVVRDMKIIRAAHPELAEADVFQVYGLVHLLDLYTGE